MRWKMPESRSAQRARWGHKLSWRPADEGGSNPSNDAVSSGVLRGRTGCLARPMRTAGQRWLLLPESSAPRGTGGAVPNPLPLKSS